jgi:ankyrin repeat protein
MAVKLLLDMRVQPEIEDCDGQTPLSCAAEFEHLEVVKLLREPVAGPYPQISSSETPLSLAAQNGH